MSTTIDGSASVTINSGAVLGITSGTAVASTSGTSIDFTGIPSWVKRITVMFNGVSLSGTSDFLVQIGAGSVTSSGYASSAELGGTATASTAGFIAKAGTAANTYSGLFTIATLGSNIWVATSVIRQGNTAGGTGGAGSGNISLSGTLDRVRITTVNGTDTFDAGSINILYE